MVDISVVMPVYNGENYLAEAIESILNQTFGNFEFIIVCEYGTSDKSIEIVKEYAEKDDRIILVFNRERLGISASLNIGMRMAQGQYIARMDADDISGIRRFEVQKEFMDVYPEIGICGTKHTVIGAPHWLVDYHSNPLQIKSELLFFVPLRHPTIMIRKSLLDSFNLYYDESLLGAEDYDYFIRASRITKLTNLMDNELFSYRRAEGNASALNRERDNEIRVSLMKNLLINDLNINLSNEDISNLVITTCFENQQISDFCSIITRLDILLNQIVKQNELLGVYDEYALCQTMIHRWHRVKYNLDLKFKKKIPDNILNCWRQGSFYRSWLE